MSIILEQTSQEISQARSIVANAAIQSVIVLSAKFWRRAEDVFSQGATLTVQVSFTPVGTKIENGRLLAETRYTCTVLPNAESSESSAKDQHLLEIECVLQAAYALKEGFVPDEQALSAFLNGNVVFNSWSFFREFVQNVSLRMEAPPPPIPFLEVHLKEEKPGRDEKAHQRKPKQRSPKLKS